MTAAFAAHGLGARVTLLARSAIGLATNSALSNGQFTGPTTDYPAASYIKDTLQIGRNLNNLARVELNAQKAPQAFAFLAQQGLNLRERQAFVSVLGHSPKVMPGATLVKRLAQNLAALPGVQTRPGLYVTQLMVDQGQVRGVSCLDRQGRTLNLPASAVILAAGGAAALYQRNDNQKNALGQGYALAARAGLDLWDMEFVQFYPIVLAAPSLPGMMIYPPYPPEARLVDHRGEDLTQKHGLGDLNQAIRAQRDRLSALIFEESQQGPVGMDLTQVPAENWQRYPLALLAGKHFPFADSPVPILPGAHFCMGGLAVDPDGATGLGGLFACGEMVWGLHGANRRGGNALTECLVTGQAAGLAAARQALAAGPDQRRASTSRKTAPAPHPALKKMRARLRALAWNHAGLLRGEDSMLEGLADLDALQEELGRLEPPQARSQAGHDLDAACLVLRAILLASLGRKESRGAFARLDYPQQNNRHWRVNSRLRVKPENGTWDLDHFPAQCPIEKVKG